MNCVAMHQNLSGACYKYRNFVLCDHDIIEQHHHCSLRMHCQDLQNDIVCTQPMLNSIINERSKLDSPTDDGSSPFFPSELISEILLRLPVKSLVRFRCVCRSWQTLISNPQFMKDHHCTIIADPNMSHRRLFSSIIKGNECKITSCSLQSFFRNPYTPPSPITYIMPHKFQILGSCNGLLCLFDIDHKYLTLWNPSTKRSSEGFPLGNDVCINSTITYHGFGYDNVNDNYKVLIVVGVFYNFITKIFTFGANSWKTIQNFPHLPSKWLGKFAGGTLNWIAKGQDDQWMILSLDLGNETFGKLLLPKIEGDEICYPVLDVLRDSLCFCDFDLKKDRSVVWLMKEYAVQESWTKLMVIPGIEQLYKWGYSFDDSLCILENGLLLKTSSTNLVMYYSEDGMLVLPVTWRNFGSSLHIYHDSLV